MKVKIDTKEKLHVITIHEPDLAANMTEEMDNVFMPLLDNNVKNVVINMKDIKYLDNAAARHLLTINKQFYSHGASFVITEFQPEVKRTLSDASLLDQLNHTLTESEAIDIVQMEELEREFGEV